MSTKLPIHNLKICVYSIQRDITPTVVRVFQCQRRKTSTTATGFGSCLGGTARFAVETWIILLKEFLPRVSCFDWREFSRDRNIMHLEHVLFCFFLRTYRFFRDVFTESEFSAAQSILTWCRSHRVSEICAIVSRLTRIQKPKSISVN